MRKCLVVFNTCGIRMESPIEYTNHINSILKQDLEDYKIAVSCCFNSDGCLWYLKDTFGDKISYNNIQDKLPISISFNDTVLKCVKEFGEFESYLFIDSGVTFGEDIFVLKNLLDLHNSGPYAMTAARTDDDLGLDDWFGTDVRGDLLFKKDHLTIPVGSAVNLHVQLFSKEVFDAYGKILPDIFAGQCMESTFSFLCAALKKKWVVHKDLVLNHKTGMDGPSSGFSPDAWVRKGKNRWDHLFGTEEPILEIIGRGYKYGMGYEENNSIVNHDESKYDEEGYAVCDELKDYIKQNLYLNDTQFDYNKINGEFTP